MVEEEGVEIADKKSLCVLWPMCLMNTWISFNQSLSQIIIEADESLQNKMLAATYQINGQPSSFNGLD